VYAAMALKVEHDFGTFSALRQGLKMNDFGTRTKLFKRDRYQVCALWASQIENADWVSKDHNFRPNLGLI
jgi:hypothetical protein